MTKNLGVITNIYSNNISVIVSLVSFVTLQHYNTKYIHAHRRACEEVL